MSDYEVPVPLKDQVPQNEYEIPVSLLAGDSGAGVYSEIPSQAERKSYVAARGNTSAAVYETPSVLVAPAAPPRPSQQRGSQRSLNAAPTEVPVVAAASIALQEENPCGNCKQQMPRGENKCSQCGAVTTVTVTNLPNGQTQITRRAMIRTSVEVKEVKTGLGIRKGDNVCCLIM